MHEYLSKSAELAPDIQLQEHQQRVQDRLTADSPRMLVYHGLGSGKSLSAIAAAEAAQQADGGNYGVVVPASLRGNFQKELGKFTRGSNPEVLSYTGLGMGKDFQDPPETLIMDEAHRLRNPGAASARAAALAAARAQRLLLLTGSPITNSPTDMANLLSLLHNKQITPEEFEKKFIGYKTVRPGILNWLRGIKPGEKPVVKNEAELRQLLSGKVDYQPSKTPEGVNVNEEVVRVPLSPAQDKIQKAIRTKIPPGFLWKLDQEFPLSREELAKLNSFMTGLRQVSLSTQPFRADKDPVKAFEQSAKLQEAFKRLQKELGSDPRKKAIIYSNFVDSGLGPYAAGLEQAKIPHAFFHGGVSPKARQAAVDAYNKGKLRALLIGPAGAEGLSTKGTSLIQLLDPHWHESRSQQAKGRGLRFDSHRDLPEELKNVAVQRYLSASKDPSFLGKLMGYKRERTGDEVLEKLTADKEQLNEEFRNLLKEEGDKYRQQQKEEEKQAAPAWVKMLRAGKLSPDAVTRLKDVIPLKTRQIGISAFGGGAEGRVFRSFTGGEGPSVIKKYHQLVQDAGGPLKNPPTWLQEQVAGMRAFPNVFAKVHGVNPVGYALELLSPNEPAGVDPSAAMKQLLDNARQTWGGDYRVMRSIARAEANSGKRMYARPMSVTMRESKNSPRAFQVSDAFSNNENMLYRPDGALVVADPRIDQIKNPVLARLQKMRASAQSAAHAQPVISAPPSSLFAGLNPLSWFKRAAELPDFSPDYTPGQLHRMGVYKSLYEKDGPRLASLGEWKPEWVTEHDPKGWLEWYQNYNAGRRIPDEDMRQIKRWANFKSRHGGPFMTNPTARRGWALRHWAINPEKLVPERAEEVRTMLQDYQAQELKKYLKRRMGQPEKQAATLPALIKSYIAEAAAAGPAFTDTTTAVKYPDGKEAAVKPTPVIRSILD